MGAAYRDRVWTNKKLKGGRLLVMLALADHADDNGECYPGMPLLMEKTRLTDRQLRRVLNGLNDDGYISIEERAIGRGKRPHYKLFPQEKADILSKEKRTLCPPIEEKADISDNKSGHFVQEKADISGAIQSHVRRESTTEPKAETEGEKAQAPGPTPPRVLRSRGRGNGAVDTLNFKSPHVDNNHFDLDTGFIPPGQGVTAVEVYYERFDVGQNKARLNPIKEDDLVRNCPDLERLREVIVAYSRTPFHLGNLQLILDWYDKGVPVKHRIEQNGANHGSYRNNSQSNGGQGDGGDPPERDPAIVKRLAEKRAKRDAERARQH